MIKWKFLIMVFLSFCEHLLCNSEWVKNSENIYVLGDKASFSTTDAIFVLDDNDIGCHLAYKFKDYLLSNIVIASQANDLNVLDKQSIDIFFKKHLFKFMFIPLKIEKDFSKNALHLAEFLSVALVKYVNLIEAAHNYHIKLFLLSPLYIYSQDALAPLSEKEWGKGINLQLVEEAVNIPLFEAVKLCQVYRYQHNDNFTVLVYPELYGLVEDAYLISGSIISDIIQKFLSYNENMKNIGIWGNPEDSIDYLYLNDLVDSLIFIMKRRENNFPFIMNIGSNCGYKMKEIVQMIVQNLNFTGKIKFNPLIRNISYRNIYLDLFNIHNRGWSFPTHISNGLKQMLSSFKVKD